MIEILKRGRQHRTLVARSLGMISLMMGGAIVFPTWYCHLFGMPKHQRIMRLIGVRDLLIGVGLLGGRERSRWLGVQASADLIDATFVASLLRRGTIQRAPGSLWLCGALVSAVVALLAAREH